MRILIISLPRTGSTSLLSSMAKENNLRPIFEPFDGTDRYPYSNNMENVVVKTIIETQKPKNCEDYLEWIKGFIKYFDRIILLSRRDLVACSESHAYSVYNKKNGFKSTDQYFWKPTPLDNICYENVIRWNQMIEDLSHDINVPVTYYEDIYDQSSINRLRKGDVSKISNPLI